MDAQRRSEDNWHSIKTIWQNTQGSQRIEEVPFDIGNYRVILYDQTIAGSKKLAERLTAAIQELLAALDRTNNPVQSVLGGRAGAHFLRRVPLFRVVDITVLTRPLHLLLEEKGIL